MEAPAGGSVEVLELVASWVVTTALSFVVVLFDERRMGEARLERAWPRASRDAALVLLGILAVPFHFRAVHLRAEADSAPSIPGEPER